MFEIDKQKFGAFIAELRKEKGFTQKELAEKLFISDKAVSKWETGQSMPDITLLRPLADILGVTTTELLEGQRLAADSTMDAKRTDELLEKVIHYSEKDSAVFAKERKRDGMLFVLCMFIGVVETLLFSNMSGEPLGVVTGPSSLNFSNLVTIELLCSIFGIYFCFFVKEKLPYYYDKDKISSYSHGVFRMNIPGVHFNNSNWPHIVKVARMWCMLTAVIFPLICICLWKLFMNVWGVFNIVMIVIVLLGGLFIPMYAVAKKYG